MVVLFDVHAGGNDHKSSGFLAVHDPAARLVGVGFRNWYLGSESGDISHWETSWRLFTDELGHDGAREVVTELACWVRAVREHTNRPIAIGKRSSAGFNADERLAISLVAASQQNACPVLQSCACALLGNDDTDEVIDSAQGLAHALSGVGMLVGAGAPLEYALA